MSLILKIPNVLLTSAHGKWYPLKYFVFVLAVGLVFLFGRGVVEGVISFSHTKPKHKVGAWILRILSMLLLLSVWRHSLLPSGQQIHCRTYTRPDDDKFEFRHRWRKPQGYEYAVPRSCFAYRCGKQFCFAYLLFQREKSYTSFTKNSAQSFRDLPKTSHGSFLGTSYAFRRRGVRCKKAFSSKALCGLC